MLTGLVEGGGVSIGVSATVAIGVPAAVAAGTIDAALAVGPGGEPAVLAPGDGADGPHAASGMSVRTRSHALVRIATPEAGATTPAPGSYTGVRARL